MAPVFFITGATVQFSRRCGAVAIPYVRSPLFHHFPVLCRDGGMYNKTGGAYLYAREAFGPFAGFLVGWMMWLSSIIGWASVASGFGLYLDYFLPTENGWLSKTIITILIVGLSAINFLVLNRGKGN